MTTPINYHPTCPAEFIGNGPEGAATIAAFIQKVVARARAQRNLPIKLLLAGDPGIGKSELALYLQSLLGCDKWTRFKLNGTQVKIETVEDLAARLAQRSMYNDYQMLWIDEADEIPRVAQVRFLSLLDDLGPGCAVICTSNLHLKNFEERFQSRFQFFQMTAPQPHELETLLCRFVDRATARAITLTANGNVRQALIDAEGVLQNAEKIAA